MKINVRPFLLLTLAICIVAGCVPSWHPLYSDKDLTFDPRLAGDWIGDDGDTWKFEGVDDKKYKFTYTDKDGRATFEAHLLKIKDRRFLDIFLHDDAEKELKLNSLSKMTVVPVHLFFRVDEIGSGLKMAVVDPEWLDKHLEKDPKAVAHLRKQDRVLLTAPTRELQEFVLRHAEGKALFGEPFALKRR